LRLGSTRAMPARPRVGEACALIENNAANGKVVVD